jgi:uncharacterized protein DUF4388
MKGVTVSGQMKSEGSLVQRDFPDLVQHLHERRWTGLLTLTHMGVGRSVTVQDGRLVFASSSSSDDRLGELLLRRGRITLRQYIDAGRAIVPGKRLGTILVEQGVLAPGDLIRAVVEHTQEIIYGAFQWTEGRYRLQEGNTAEAITLNISTPDLIMEGIHRIDAWSRVDRAVGGLSARYERAKGYEGIVARMSLPDEKLDLLTTFAGIQDVETICDESSLPDFEVCRTLWAFRVIGLVRRVDAPQDKTSEPDDEGLGLVL